MIIQLPEQFAYHVSGTHAYVRNETLFMTVYNFEEIMYALTYELKGEQYCFYCHKELGECNKTLDHVYPRDFGGISIPENLEPCCKKCNSEKNNFFPWQYKRLRHIKDKAIKRQEIEDMYQTNFEKRKQRGILLPKRWYEMHTDYTVFAPINSEQEFKTSHKYQRLQEKYETYGQICRPIVVSQNRIVIDGFMALLLAKNLGIKEPLPFITLENVVVM